MVNQDSIHLLRHLILLRWVSYNLMMLYAAYVQIFHVGSRCVLSITLRSKYLELENIIYVRRKWILNRRGVDLKLPNFVTDLSLSLFGALLDLIQGFRLSVYRLYNCLPGKFIGKRYETSRLA